MDFSKELINWYSDNKRDLPWRGTQNAYYIWLSEIILQQTQVKQGLPYYNAFVSKYPTIQDLANANEEDVLNLWQGLGYYSRARNLHFTAKYITTELNGIFPNNYKDLIKLKGIGDYTASAIASFAFKEIAAVVDGNVYRVLSRYFGIDTPINSTKGIKDFKTLASSLIDTKRPDIFNQAIMEFGAIQCKPKNPYCLVCPLHNGCASLEKNLVAQRPVKLKKTKVTTKYFNFLVCVDKDKNILFEKRIGKGIWQNLYQFPLVESSKSLAIDEFHLLDLDSVLPKNMLFEHSLYNETDKIHKLSHQHLHTKFWILEVTKLSQKSIAVGDLQNYPASVLINDFINEFNFENL